NGWHCGREMAREGFKAHVEDVELEHLDLPHLGKHGREPSLASYESALIETTWAMGVHLNLPGDLALALGFPVSTI
ncbi:hypothetical protein KI387_011417, partial [Taxus chinensis]